jgi:hypothetical protein
MNDHPPIDAGESVAPQKQQLLLALYQVGWDEMTWRRNAGYRTVILGLGYCGVILTVLAYNRQMNGNLKACLATVIALATLFGAGYLVSNYKKYMAAAGRIVAIEAYLGAFDDNFLGKRGPLMPKQRHEWPRVPLTRDPVCFWSVLAFLGGGLVTAGAILLA